MRMNPILSLAAAVALALGFGLPAQENAPVSRSVAWGPVQEGGPRL